MIRRAKAILAIAVITCVSGCGGSKGTQAPFVPSFVAGLTVTCPADQNVSAIGDAPTPVTWSNPTTENGVGEVAITCTPPSGAGFESGTTTVQCEASDSQQSVASCSFKVTVLPALTIACPANQNVLGTSALTPVSWSAPTTEHGVDPVSVTCTPGSGSNFAPGTSPVQCAVQDGVERAASCSFVVTVKVPRTTKTKYVAFGDSITEGFLRDQPQTYVVQSLTYPGQLATMLATKYPAQSITVVNEGLGGETAEEGRARIPGVLDRRKPRGLLVLEGYNRIRFTAPSSIENNLRLMVGEGQKRGVSVILATLTPVTPGKEKEAPGATSAIKAVNTKIRALAPRMGVPLVDVFKLLDGQWSLFGSDGVHPNPAGYQKMAKAFFQEIVRRFDAPPALLPPDTTLFVAPGDVPVDDSVR